MKPRGRWILVSLVMLLLSATVLWAEDDPPGRVARLQYMSGSVSIQPQGTQDWVEAAINRPLTNSDNVWTDKASRAELNVGTGTLRMDSESSLTLTNINDGTVQVELHQGTLSLHLRKLFDGEIYEIDTPNFAFTVQKSGDYRFDVAPEGDTSVVTVWKGEGDATGEGPSVRVRAHEQARFSGGTSLAHTFAAAPGLDGFDDWGRVRDQREDRSISAQYVSRDVIGYEDLDDYGYWQTVPSYGPIWVPRGVAAGWAPYRYGHWVWISPWGWTWVDDAPWGFAPFHYGRWVYYNNYWGWAPGPAYVRPVYAPALVAWFGGGGWGVSLGFGGGPGYGWCPLGWGEPFVPWYHGSRGYFRNVNISNTHITNITNVTNIYYNKGIVPDRYINMHRGGTAVPERALLDSRPVGRSFVKVSDNDWNRAPRGHVELSPTRESRLGENAGRPAALPPQRAFSRPVESKLARPKGPEGREFPINANRPSAPMSPRPEVGKGGPINAQNPSETRGGFGNNNPARNVPRPPERGMEGNGNNTPRMNPPDNSPRSGAIQSSRPDNVQLHANPRQGGEMNVPRPPQRGMEGDRNNTPRMNAPDNSPRSGAIQNNPPAEMRANPRPGNEVTAPRPPENNRGNEHANQPPRTEPPSGGPHSGSTPSNPDRGPAVRPPGNDRNNAPQPPPNVNRGTENRGNENHGGQNRGGQNGSRPDPTPHNNFTRQNNGGRAYVPRPSGPVIPVSRQRVEYASAGSARSYSPSAQNSYGRGSYGDTQRTYSAPRSYSSPSVNRGGSYGASPSYGRGSYGDAQRSYSAPRSYSSPSVNRGGSYSASPSYRSAPQHYSMPSASRGGNYGGGRSYGNAGTYHSGGQSRPSSGGSRSFGGGSRAGRRG